MRETLRAARRLARRSHVGLYLVGGVVRDLLLGRPAEDVDLVVERDGIRFARRLARQVSARVREHPRFRTATLELPHGRRLDVATARAERYAVPGALPQVESGGIMEDLARRDFAVNAIAIRIAPGAPRLFDPFGGVEDLRKGVIRMLHPASPIDDPTRAFRAARYANRLNFRIDRQTRRWIRLAAASGACRRISRDRLRREVVRILSEKHRARAVGWLVRLGIAGAVDPALAGDGRALGRLRRAERLAERSRHVTTWLLYLLVWAADLTVPQARELAARLNLPRRETRIVERWVETRGRSSDAAGAPSPEPTADELVADETLQANPKRGRLVPESRIRGRDLVAAGIPPGPAIGRALARTRAALRSGAISPEEELSFALRVVGEVGT